MSNVIYITAAQDAVDDRISLQLMDKVADVLCRSISEDDRIDTKNLLVAFEKVIPSIGEIRARRYFGSAWWTTMEVLDDFITKATSELRAAGAFEDR